MKQIREWLEKEGAYLDGVALYETHGKSRVVLNSLRYGETAFTRATLVRELGKLAAAVPEKPVRGIDTSVERVRETPKSVQVAPASLSKEPVKTDELRAERSAWYAERARLHAQLELVATDAERRLMGERILVLSEQLAASYELVALVPAAAPDLSALTDLGEVRRLLANRRSQASKLKKNPARAADLQQALADIAILKNYLKPTI